MEVAQFIPTLWNMDDYESWLSRLLKKIGELIEDGTFAYEDETLPVNEQLAKFKEDGKGCITGFIYDIQSKLKYGILEWSELR